MQLTRRRLEESSGSETDSDQKTTGLLAGRSTGERNGVVASWLVGGWGSSSVWDGCHGGGWAAWADSSTVTTIASVTTVSASWRSWGWVDGDHGGDVGWHAGRDGLGRDD